MHKQHCVKFYISRQHYMPVEIENTASVHHNASMYYCVWSTQPWLSQPPSCKHVSGPLNKAHGEVKVKALHREVSFYMISVPW